MTLEVGFLNHHIMTLRCDLERTAAILLASAGNTTQAKNNQRFKKCGETKTQEFHRLCPFTQPVSLFYLLSARYAVLPCSFLHSCTSRPPAGEAYLILAKSVRAKAEGTLLGRGPRGLRAESQILGTAPAYRD